MNATEDNRASYGSIAPDDLESCTYIGNGRMEISDKRHWTTDVRCSPTNNCGKWARIRTYAEHADKTCSCKCIHCRALLKPSWKYSSMQKHVIYQALCFLNQGINTKQENPREMLGDDWFFKADEKG